MKCDDCKFFLKDQSGYNTYGWCNMRFPPHHAKNANNLTHPTDGCDLGQPNSKRQEDLAALAKELEAMRQIDG